MNKNLKKSVSVILTLLIISPIFAAKKTSEDWQKEIEAVAGQLEWAYPENFSKAKNFLGDEVYCIDTTKRKQRVIPANFLIEKSKISHFILLDEYDAVSKMNKANLDTLSKGDVFFTCKGEKIGRSDLWVLAGKTVLKQVININDNGGISLTSAAGSMASKYAGWSTVTNSGDTLVAGTNKGVYQGSTYYSENAGYYSNANPKKGELKIMITDYTTKNIIEYTLYYLGSTNNLPSVKKAIDEKNIKK